MHANAQTRADNAYAALNDGTERTAQEKFRLAIELQASQALVKATEARIQSLEEAAKLEKFQAGASDRLDKGFQSTTAAGMHDPAARSMFEGRVDVLRDADKTTDDEKAGRAAIATQAFRQVIADQQAKWAKGFLEEWDRGIAVNNKFSLEGLGRGLEAKRKAAENQVKEDSEARSGVRDSGRHDERMAGIQSAPGDELDLAKQMLAIRRNTLMAENDILEARRESYTAEQAQLEGDRLNREYANAEWEYQERTEAILKRRAQDAINAGGAYQQRLASLAQELENLRSITVTEGNVLDIEASRKAIHDHILETVVQERLAIGGLKDGWEAFWVSMEEYAEKPGKILYDGLHSALDTVSGDLARLATGQKTSFGKDLQQVGTKIAQDSFKSIIQTGLGKLGGALGIHGAAAKPIGTKSDPIYAVLVDGLAAGAGITSGGSGGGLESLGGALKSVGGKLAGLFGKVFGSGDIPGLASGGDMDPGSIYRIAEGGEGEFVTPGGKSTVTPLSKMGFGEAHSHTYNIDARGADLGAENRVMRAIEYAHNQAVVNSVRANAELLKRAPQRSK